MRALAQALLFGLALAVAGPAAAACRQALILALDVSGSVDAREYRLQLDGVAGALTDPAVRDELLSFPDAPVALAVFEWSGRLFQRPLVGWTLLAHPADIEAVAARLRATERVPAPRTTGIGAALEVAAAELGRAPACDRWTVDVSGDGRNNDWPAPRDVHKRGVLNRATVNALVIGSGGDGTGETMTKDLPQYFREEVIRGLGAFVETAADFDDYARAIKAKLLREIASMPIGVLTPENRP